MMLETSSSESRILLIDDQEANLLLLERLLRRDGYTNTKSLTDPRLARPFFTTFEPDLVILDLLMPYLDGFQVMAQLRPLSPPGAYLPILILTADVSPETRRRALAEGATDFLTKPLDAVEVQLRVRNLLETRRLYRRLRDHNEILEATVQVRTAELREAHEDILRRLALAAEYRDDDTRQHTDRVGVASGRLAREMGLPKEEIELIRQASPLHDLGKIGISDLILLKPGRLTTEEFDQIKQHVAYGAKILEGSESNILQLAETIARNHHERWDGSGYLGLRGKEIPMAARIVTVADVFDALTHIQPYKQAWSIEQAAEEIAAQAGRQFDPDVVEAFQRQLERDSRVAGNHWAGYSLG